MDDVRIENVADLPLTRKEMGEAYAFDRHILVPGDGSTRCGVRLYSIPPGKANYPYHAHETHEEVFYIISGEGIAETEAGERPLRPGDVMICPSTPGGAHKIVNRSDVPLVYLEVDAVSFPEVAHYPRSGGMGVLYADQARNAFYIDGKQVPYQEICDRG